VAAETNRSFSVVITETIRYSKVYDEAAIAERLDMSREFLAGLSDNEVIDVLREDAVIEEDLQRHGDVQGSSWAVERDRSAEIPTDVKAPVGEGDWDF
jgi:hypothetical protein